MVKCPGCDAEAHPSYRAHWFKSAVVNAPVVVNKPVAEVVNARTKDRHRKTLERSAYIAQKMREYRKRRSEKRV